MDTLSNFVLSPSLQVIIDSFEIVRCCITFELNDNGHLELLSTDDASVSKPLAICEGTGALGIPVMRYSRARRFSTSCGVACHLAPRDSCRSICMAFPFKCPDKVL
jgi:hypothetical protein